MYMAIHSKLVRRNIAIFSHKTDLILNISFKVILDLQRINFDKKKNYFKKFSDVNFKDSPWT